MWRARAKKIDSDSTLTSSQYALHSMTFSYICWKKFQGSLLWGAFRFAYVLSLWKGESVHDIECTRTMAL